MLIIVGLGTGSLDDLPLGVYKLLKEKTYKKYFRTQHHPVVQQLQEEGVEFQTFDAFYDESDTFSEVYRKIAEKIIHEEEKDVIYAVPGHPLVAEESVANIVSIANNQGIPYRIQPAMSFLDQLFSALHIDPINGLTIIDALQIEQQPPNLAQGNVLTQVYNRQVASDLKLTLMEFYPDEFEITVLRALGIPDQEKIEGIKLYELDRIEWLDHLTTIYVPPLKETYLEKIYPLDPLVNVMVELRGESGCPWDKEQTHQTLKKHLLEETYEVLEALEEEDMYKLREELGDLLLQIVFHSQIASENEYFDINDVIMEIKEKLIRRHPHIFGDTEANTSGQVVRNWEQIKKKEKISKGLVFESVLDNITKTLPGLLKAEELQKRAAQVGFDWPDYKGALDKVDEEFNEVLEALVTGGDIGKIEEELGDLLFAIVNFARFFKINPEEAVSKTNMKFSNRFKFMEKTIRQEGLNMTELSLNQLDKYWDLAKGAEKGTK